MSFHAVVFDLDGTLLNTLADIADAANSVLRNRGFDTHSYDSYRYLVGDGVVMLFTRALPAECRTPELIGACREEFRAAYDRCWNVRTEPYAGIPELLDALAERRLKLAVLSNKPDDFTRRCVEHFLPAWRFDAVLGQRDGVPRKPNAAGAIEIANRLELAATNCVYVGDTSVDMETARNAGMYAVGVAWGFRPVEELQRAGARIIIESPGDLVGVLGGTAWRSV